MVADAMTSTKGLLLNAIGRLVLRDARITAVRQLGDDLRAIALEGDGLRDVAWVPGDKVQVLLPTRDVRTYTPTAWDAARGATERIVFDHGASPGASWSRQARPGDRCRFVGPQRSLQRPRGRPAVLFGDETSLGVALALHRADPHAPLACVLEVGSRARVEAAAAAIELPTAALLARTAGDGHLAEVAAQLERHLGAHAGAQLLMTGRAQSIQAVRSRLRGAGVRDAGASKPYWSVGKTGLD